MVSTGEDVAAQIAAVNNFIDSGFDAIVVDAENPTAWTKSWSEPRFSSRPIQIAASPMPGIGWAVEPTAQTPIGAVSLSARFPANGVTGLRTIPKH